MPDAAREVSLDQWGKALLEELLFRAAQCASQSESAASSIEVSLRFRVTANVADDCLEIRTERAAEPPLATRLPRPF